MVLGSDVQAWARSPKLARAGLGKPSQAWAALRALRGPRLRLQFCQARAVGLSRGLGKLLVSRRVVFASYYKIMQIPTWQLAPLHITLNRKFTNIVHQHITWCMSCNLQQAMQARIDNGDTTTTTGSASSTATMDATELRRKGLKMHTRAPSNSMFFFVLLSYFSNNGWID